MSAWTDERIETLKALWAAGKTGSQIAAAIGHGLTRNAIIGKINRLRLAGRAKSTDTAAPPLRAPPKPKFAHPGNIMRKAEARKLDPGPPMIADPPRQEGETEAIIPMSPRVTIVELNDSMCRWPLGDPASPEFRYCGSPAPGAARM